MTIPLTLGEIVAERRLEATAEDGTRTDVLVRIGRPVPDPQTPAGRPDHDWCCPHQVLGLGEETVQAAYGVDSLQALLLGVHRLRLTLKERARTASVHLDWLGQGDLGLKVDPGTHRLLLGTAPD